MKVSVAIPAYNSAATIGRTLDSVLRQSVQPDEILVLDDGSTDDTPSLLRSYEPRITVFQRKNSGVASARNFLCKKAQGDLVAFLDHDDIWHPEYLRTQRRLFEDHPDAAVFFTGHVDFSGYGDYQWDDAPLGANLNVEFLDPLKFFKRYNRTTGPFASMSYCCIAKRVLAQMGESPFRIDGVEDSYFLTFLPLFGPAVYAEAPLVAYRITGESLSVNKLRDFGRWVEVFDFLEARFRNVQDRRLARAFKAAFASKRRQYAKRLMGAGQTLEARRQLKSSVKNSKGPSSVVKSLALLMLTFMPPGLQPAWPSQYREWNTPQYK